MPPKAKKPEANRKNEPVEDETGIPKNEVAFKLNFQIKQNEVENLLVMVEWISSSDTAAREKLDTDLIECWNQPNPEDPTLLNFEMELPFVRVEDKFVKNICSNKFYVYFVSAEDQTVKDTYYLNYSPLLTAKGEPKFEFYHDKIKIPEIEHFRMTISADKELLTPLYRDYLNPLEICIVGAKEMPVNNSGYDKYEPVYVQAKFFDGTIIKTHELPHGSTYRWMYKQVILVGFMNHIKLMEELKSIPLQFEIHDQDEVAKNQIREFKQIVDIKYEEPEPPVEIDPKAKGAKGAAAAKGREKSADPSKKKEDNKAKDAKDPKAKDPKAKDAKGKKDAKKKKDIKSFEPIKQEDKREFIRGNYGISSFNLNDLLNPHANSLKIRNYIVPLQKFENKDAKNLDLNTTARRELQHAHISCDYLSNESYLVVTFEIAHGIRPFKKPAAPETALPPVDPKSARPGSKQASKPAPAASKDNKKDVPKEAPVKAEVPEEKPIFERAVYIFPYKSPELTPTLLSIVQDINMAAFGQAGGNPLFLTTKALSEEERKNRNLDIITGLEFIDNEYRTFILEGLADKGMKKLEEEFPKTQPNSKDLKILKNPDCKFKERLYLDFNIDIKKIRLRENLAKLLTKPEIYLRSKVPEHIYHILVTFSEIRRCDNMKTVIASNLFPDVENTIAMERKYGDALTDEDVHGKEGPPQKIVSRTAAKIGDLASDLGLSGILSTTSRQLVPPTKSKQRLSPELSQALEKSTDSKELPAIRSMSTKLATRIDNQKQEKYTLRMTKMYPLQEGEVYTSAGTKLNIYEKQKAELREIARNDPNHFYTYSADYLSLSIDPYAPEDIKRIEEETKQKLWKTPQGFQTILKKSKKDYITHPKKPHQSKVDELSTFPWHQDKLEQTKKLANSRGEPIRNGPDFRTQIGKIDTFSSPEIVEAEKITAVEKERQLKEAKRTTDEAWKAKVVVENPYFYTSLCTTKNSQLDKIKSIREGDAKKKGLIMKDSRLKSTTLGTTKTIQENPISMYLTEEWDEQGGKNLFERQYDMKKSVSEYDFKRNIKQSYQYNMVYKPVKEIFN